MWNHQINEISWNNIVSTCNKARVHFIRDMPRGGEAFLSHIEMETMCAANVKKSDTSAGRPISSNFSEFGSILVLTTLIVVIYVV